jgi:hypothetical protein
MTKEERNALEKQRLIELLTELSGAYDRLLKAYGKPFEWGRILTEMAREEIKLHADPLSSSVMGSSGTDHNNKGD